MVGKTKAINSSREMNQKNKEDSQTRPILFLISMMIFVFCSLPLPGQLNVTL